MRQPMRCSRCGNALYHYVTDIKGRVSYRCNGMLSGFTKDLKRTRLYECDSYYFENGQGFSGWIAYQTGGKVKTIKVGRGIL